METLYSADSEGKKSYRHRRPAPAPCPRRRGPSKRAHRQYDRQCQGYANAALPPDQRSYSSAQEHRQPRGKDAKGNGGLRVRGHSEKADNERAKKQECHGHRANEFRDWFEGRCGADHDAIKRPKGQAYENGAYDARFGLVTHGRAA
jgi:hypothetical protein